MARSGRVLLQQRDRREGGPDRPERRDGIYNDGIVQRHALHLDARAASEEHAAHVEPQPGTYTYHHTYSHAGPESLVWRAGRPGIRRMPHGWDVHHAGLVGLPPLPPR